MSPTELLKCARTVGLGPSELRSVMYDLPYPTGTRTRQIDPCPLSTREVEVLKRLAEGKVYKQIATSSPSRRARCAPTCTTSTASSAPSTAPRPS